MHIRLATPADLDSLFSLWCQLMDQHQAYHPIFGYHTAAAFRLKQGLRGRIQEPHTRIFVADTDTHKVVGLLLATYQTGSSGMHYFRRGYIAETIVAAEHRGQGIGRALVAAAKSWLISQGADHLELQVAVQNQTALRFWQAQGFGVTTQHLMLPLQPPPVA
ncbi:GNAT family N-acetyltransferase [Hymenobacter puniceus]|uniref:GNAT family N-acetyltransferase n=1 Tax=Hymenobacter sp. BT190 TaxID=2763505 RepID=UPI0016511946|nr:GNAT family N-acetyltransferase [Hymenobacter sp. BT190]MBC6696557.1 GNAT family N-acetyltransferase [Hymenobacter sp. BT190]